MIDQAPIPGPPSPWVTIRSLVVRWLITSLAIAAAVLVVPGIRFSGPGWELGIIAAIFGLINVLLKPLLTLLTCPLVVLTLGLFGIIINAALLLLTQEIAVLLGFEFVIDTFWSAMGGALVISIVSLLLNVLSGETRVVTMTNEPRREE